MSKIAKSIAVLGVVAGLGVAALPLSTYAANTAEDGPVTVKVTVNNDLAIASDTYEVDFGELNSGSGVQTKSADLTVSGTVKYNLFVRDTDTITALTLMNDDGTPDTTTNAGIPNATTLTAGTSGWGVKLSGGNWVVLNGTTNVPLGSGDLTQGNPITETIEFGVSVGSGLDNGTYQDQIIFTAIEDAA